MPKGMKRTAEEKLNDQLSLFDKRISTAEAIVKALKKECKNVEDSFPISNLTKLLNLLLSLESSLKRCKRQFPL